MKMLNIFRKMLATLVVATVAITAMPLTAFAASRSASAVDPTKYLSNTFFIKNKKSGKYLDVQGGQSTNGANLVQWSFTGNKNQQWKLKKQSNGTYKIVSALSGNPSIDISGKSDKNGANAQIWKSNQTFKLVKTSGNYYKIQSSVSGRASKVLNVAGASKNNGANVIQWSFGQAGNDQWLFQRVVNAKNNISPELQDLLDRYEQAADEYLSLAKRWNTNDRFWDDDDFPVVRRLDQLEDEIERLMRYGNLSSAELSYCNSALARIERKIDEAENILDRFERD